MSVFDEDESSAFEAHTLLTALYLFNDTMSYIPRPKMKRAISNFADKTLRQTYFDCMNRCCIFTRI